MYEAERLLMADVPLIPLYSYVTKRMVNPRLKGWQSNVMDHHYSKDMYFLKAADEENPAAPVVTETEATIVEPDKESPAPANNDEAAQPGQDGGTPMSADKSAGDTETGGATQTQQAIPPGDAASEAPVEDVDTSPAPEDTENGVPVEDADNKLIPENTDSKIPATDTPPEDDGDDDTVAEGVRQ
jgi:hypothetical protein